MVLCVTRRYRLLQELAVYPLPGSNIDFVMRLNGFLYDLRVSSEKVIIAGDLNLQGIYWNSQMVANGSTAISLAFLDLVFSHNLNQVDKESVRE